MKLIAPLMLCLCLSAQADAQELTDVALGHDEAGPWLWLAFDRQPEAIQMSDVGHLVIEGFSSSAREIDIAQGGEINRVTLSPMGADSTQIQFLGSDFRLQPELRQGGILVRWTGNASSGLDRDIESIPDVRLDEVSATHQPSSSDMETVEEFPIYSAESLLTERETEPHTESVLAHEESTEAVITTDSDLTIARDESQSDISPNASTPEAASLELDSPESDPSEPDDLEVQTDAPLILRPDNTRAETSSDTLSGSACTQSGTALENAPWDMAAMSLHAGCLAEAGQRDDAATLYEQILAFEPEHYEAALGLAAIKADTGDVERARQLYMDAVRAARTDGEALSARALAEALGDAG